MKILCFGSLNIDHVYRVKDIVKPGQTVSSSGYSQYFGGKGLNQSIALSRMSKEVYHAGKLGDDGQQIFDTLIDNSVHTKYIYHSEKNTGTAIIQVDDSGENSIIVLPGANHEITFDEINDTLSDFEAGDYLVLQNEINNVNYIINQAQDRGMIIVLNPSPINEELLNFDLNKINYLILNRDEAYTISNTSSVEESLLYFKFRYDELKVVLTTGEEGVHYQDMDYYFFTPSYLVKNVIDTTCAGDTFLGFFIGSLSQGLSLETAIDNALKASSKAVMVKGAAISIPL